MPLSGYSNIDINENNPVYPLPYATNSVDEIRASHILEHFGIDESMDVICEWHRVLKVGGTLKIAVPDFKLLAESYLKQGNLHSMLEMVIVGGQSDEYDYHKSLWDYDKLHTVFSCLGYDNIVRWQSEIPDCASYTISLNLQGIKREQTEDNGNHVSTEAGIQ